VTDEVDNKVAHGLAREAERLRTTAVKLDCIAGRTLREPDDK
jgi:hypothetical protein